MALLAHMTNRRLWIAGTDYSVVTVDRDENERAYKTGYKTNPALGYTAILGEAESATHERSITGQDEKRKSS
jgi:hypothetical protein